MPNNTLEKWDEKTLGELCDVLDSRRKPITKKDRVAGVYPYYGATGILDYVSGWIFDEELVLLGEDGAKWTSGEQSAFKINGKTWVNNHAHVLRPKRDRISDTYLIYNLNFQNLMPYITGTTVPKLNQEKMRSITIPLPPFPEQERIVAKLDKAFEAIDKVKANAEQNLNNAKEIYNIKKELIFKTVLENKPVEFGDIIELLTDYHANGSYKLLKEHVELLDNENYAWMIRSTDFENEFKNNFKYINEKAYNFLEKTKIFGNEIIMSKIGNAGKIYLMPVVNRPVSLAMNLFLIRVKKKLAISSYVYRFLLTNIGQKQINERCKGAATQTITKDNVRSIKIYLPNTLSEQQKIVEKLDALQEQTKHLEQIYTKKIKECDELKQSILQKAFRGEL